MDSINNILGVEGETLRSVISSVFGILSVFIIVSIGYYSYSYFFEKNK